MTINPASLGVVALATDTFPSLAVNADVPTGTPVTVTASVANIDSPSFGDCADDAGNTWAVISDTTETFYKERVYHSVLTSALTAGQNISPGASWTGSGQGTKLHCGVTATRGA